MTGMLAELCRGAEENLCRHVISNVSSTSRDYSKKWWPHWAHTDTTKIYTDARVQCV